MTKPKLTPWINGKFKPVRDGVYQRDYTDRFCSGYDFAYCLFKKNMWHVASNNYESASQKEFASCVQNLPWRGLAENPNKEKKK